MKHLGDITKINGAEIEPVDCIIGGSPCQDLSVAGKRAGLAGERSGLFMEQIRIVKEMREHERSVRGTDEHIRLRPRYMVWENVPGAFSSHGGKDFQAVLTEIVRIVEPEAPDVPLPEKGWPHSGCLYDELGKWSVAWRVHDAQFWGVPQRRKRIALVADFGGLSAPEILFERKGLQGDTGEGEKEGQGTPKAAFGCADGAGENTIGFNRERDGVSAASGIMPTLQAAAGESDNNKPMVLACDVYNGAVTGETTPTMTANTGTSATHAGPMVLSFQERVGKPGGGKGILIQNERVTALPTLNNQSVLSYGISSFESNGMKSGNPHSGIYEADVARTIDANGGNPACNQGGTIVVEENGSRASHKGGGFKASDTMYTLNTVERHAVVCLNDQGGSVMDISDNVSGTLRAQEHGHQPVVAVHQNASGEVRESDIAYTIGTTSNASGRNTPMVYDARGNGDGQTVCTLTGDHQNRVTDYTALCMDVGFFQTNVEKCRALLARQYKDLPITVGTLCAESYPGKLAHQDVQSGLFPVTNAIVRRLTPLECERLQGYPDGWTDIGDWVDSNGKKHKAADSPRYKALGNSIALPFWFYLLRRISAQYERPATLGSLFDGIGGFPLCWERCNGSGTAIWASEIEEFPIAVTKKHFPEE